MASTPYATSDALAISGIQSIPFFLLNVSMASTADVVTDYVVPFSFQVLGLRYVVNAPVTTGSKAVTVIAGTGATGSNTAVPGVSLALTSALCTPLGKILSAPATNLGTAATTFAGGTKICLKATVTTSFAEGSGTFFLDLRNCDES